VPLFEAGIRVRVHGGHRFGIDDAAREETSARLGHVPADAYTLYLKTQNHRWNLTGPMFRSLHLPFEEQCIELRDAVDEVAERIRSLGYPAPGSVAEHGRLTGIPESRGSPEAKEMARGLAERHATAAHTARSAIEVAEDAGDVATPEPATLRIGPTRRPLGCCGRPRRSGLLTTGALPRAERRSNPVPWGRAGP
jgi:starvation-inducible DNA-binding protein